MEWSSEYKVMFFFSSRRRHTRFDCDWSSDVCSSDLVAAGHAARVTLATDAYPRTGSRQTSLPMRESSGGSASRSEEHTSELQSQSNLVCRLLLEKKKNNTVSTI